VFVLHADKNNKGGCCMNPTLAAKKSRCPEDSKALNSGYFCGLYAARDPDPEGTPAVS
jgi:hypothetical protein